MKNIRVQFLTVNYDALESSQEEVNKFLASHDVTDVQFIPGFPSASGGAWYSKVMVVYREASA